MHGHMMESCRYAEAAEVFGGDTPPPRLAAEAAWGRGDDEAVWAHDDGEADGEATWDSEAWAHDDGEADDEAAWDDEALPLDCTWDR